jgi:hypothetical protein
MSLGSVARVSSTIRTARSPSSGGYRFCGSDMSPASLPRYGVSKNPRTVFSWTRPTTSWPFSAFPVEHWPKMRSNKSTPERLNKEIRPRTGVVGIFLTERTSSDSSAPSWLSRPTNGVNSAK